jgi:hypothetical protein
MKTIHNQTTRRTALKAIATAVAGLGISRIVTAGEGNDLPHLTDANPAAASLSYTENADSVDARKFPKHQASQRCATCKYFQTGTGSVYAPCRLYPGNAVNANGWCAGYVSV